MKTLAELRKERNMTQKQLAEALRISVSAVAMYEIGERTPSLKVAKRIAEFFNIPIEQIDFFGEHRSHNESKNMRSSKTNRINVVLNKPQTYVTPKGVDL